MKSRTIFVGLVFLLASFCLSGSSLGASPKPNKTLFAGVGVNFQMSMEHENYGPDVVAIDKILERYRLTPEYESSLLTAGRATKQNILELLDWVAENTEENDVAMVYISCHGSYSAEKGFFFCCANYGSDEQDYVTGKEMRERLEKVKGKLILVVDTCHAGGMLIDWPGNERTMIIASCKTEEPSYGHSFFDAFISSLMNSDYNYNNTIELSEIQESLPQTIRSPYKQTIVYSRNTLKLSLIRAHGPQYYVGV